MKTKPDLSFWKLWNLSFGFFGVQIAYALQSANVSRIFATLGADPHDLSYFWILPPLMGLVVQPIVGTASDHTWNRFGRRLPYLIAGALVAVAVMCLLPNAGSFGLAVSSAILIGLFALMLLDTSINMAMQPFKMLVGDMVNERQKGLAYSIQSFLCNAGSIVGYVFPFLLTWIGFQNTAAAGVIPQTVVFSFYFGAAILLLCVVYSLMKIKEWPPQLYAEYNGGGNAAASDKKEKTNLIKLLVNAPKTFWTVGLVQFFCWFAFLFMWTYTNGTIAKQAFNCPETTTIHGITETLADGSSATYNAKYILTADSMLIVDNGKAAVAGIVDADGVFHAATEVQLTTTSQPEQKIDFGGLDITAPTMGIERVTPVVTADMLASTNGISRFAFNTPVETEGRTLIINGNEGIDTPSFTIVDRLSQMKGGSGIIMADIYTHDPNSGALFLDGDARRPCQMRLRYLDCTQHRIRRIQRRWQLGRYPLRRAGHRIGAVGRLPPAVPQPQVLLFAQPYARCGRFYLCRPDYQPISALRVIPSHRLRVGRYARMALHHTDQLAEVRQYRRIPRPVQLLDMHSADCGRSCRRMDSLCHRFAQ